MARKMTQETGKDPSEVRVDNHNNWPFVELFDCEKEFLARMAQKNIQQIFVTAKLSPNKDDEPFNSAVGHILDCLDSLPRRPDAGFDCIYKTIDNFLGAFPPSEKSPLHNAVNTLFHSNQDAWSEITSILMANFPQQSADYAATRILECHVDKQLPHAEEIKRRARRSIESDRYEEFLDKYLITNPQMPGEYFLKNDGERNAGRLFRMMMRLEGPLELEEDKTPEVFPAGNKLNFYDSASVIENQVKMNILMEVLVYTYRNERFHGDTFSPFRSGKAKMKTYAHAYFMLISSYIFLLGILEFKGMGGLNISDVVNVARSSMDSFSRFFEDHVNK